MDEPRIHIPIRPRRNRRTESIRSMVRETTLEPSDLIWPLFVVEGRQQRIPVASMPGCDRFSIDLLVAEAREALSMGVPAVALFPALDESLKDPTAKESTNQDGLLQRTIRELKEKVTGLTVITDVAMDPYSSDGHDGLVRNGEIVNDETLEILADMSIAQAEAGADIVAPSDMMDGRIGYIRDALDDSGFTNVGILAYSAKYASAFYGPFREALDSAPRGGDKKTYQMDPANADEALREVVLDVQEGADMVMVKPAMPYLDVVAAVKATVDLPVAAYQVSGEYAMLHAAGEKGWLDTEAVLLESLLGIRRAGADMILTYAAKQVAAKL
jgi:porphobilinogen synthase